MKNSFLLGLFIGILAPLVSYLLNTFTKLQETFFADKLIALYVLAALINLVILRFAHRSGKDLLAKGVLLTTFIAMLILIIFGDIKI